MSMEPGENFIIPIEPVKHPLDYEIFVPNVGKCTVYAKAHNVELGFAITLHKIQGQTCSKIILDLNKRTSQPYLDFSGLYVGLSRVKKSDDLRLMPLHQGSPGLDYLKNLKPPKDLLDWHKGFDQDKGRGKRWFPEKVTLQNDERESKKREASKKKRSS